MVVTATQFKANIGRYLDTVSGGDVYITKNGKMVAKLSDPMQNKLSILDSLVGIVAGNNTTIEEAKKERLSRQ